MSASTSKAADIERERRELLDDAAEGVDLEAEYGPGSFGCHELLDRTALAMKLVDDSIRAHPSCASRSEWFALADQALEALAALYQGVGVEHLDPAADKRNGSEDLNHAGSAEGGVRTKSGGR